MYYIHRFRTTNQTRLVVIFWFHFRPQLCKIDQKEKPNVVFPTRPLLPFPIAGAFFLYAGFAATGLLFIYGCLPETKGKKLEEIESLFDNRLCTCGASDSDEGRYIEYIRVKGSNYHLSDNDASDVE